MVGGHTLLRSQRRQVFELLREVGLEPADFFWSEREELEGRIVVSRLADRIEKELGLDGRQMKLIQMKLGYLAEAARRQRSRDWVYAALGVCITIAMSLSQPPGKAAALWQLIRAEIGRHVPLSSTQPDPRRTMEESCCR